jgi:predicted phosphoribosyltransferase
MHLDMPLFLNQNIRRLWATLRNTPKSCLDGSAQPGNCPHTGDNERYNAERRNSGGKADVMQQPFPDRTAAGQLLAEQLARYRGTPSILVLGLPRGGVPVAYEVAKALGAPLDVFVVRKLGVPGHEELALGAIASGGVRVLNDDVVQHVAHSEDVIEELTQREQQEVTQRERRYRGDRPAPTIAGRTVILVDDGLATGATMRAACDAVRQQQPAQIVVAVPVAAPATCDEMQQHADDVICAVTPPALGGIGGWYADFRQTSDKEVQQLLEQAASERAA